MKAVRSLQKYKCDFCRKRGIKSAMERHEKICFRNPNRFCDFCKNKGETDEGVEEYTNMVPCPYCSTFDKEKLKDIEKWEQENETGEKEVIKSLKVPF